MIAVIVFLVLVLGWVLVSRRLTARSITGPIALTVAGFLLARAPVGVDLDLEADSVRELIEVTLAAETRGWVLPTLLPLAPVIMAITTYFVTVEVGGNGFVAAFVCGVAFGGTVSNERGRSTSCSPSRSACCSVSVCGSSSVPASWQRSQGR